MYKYKIKEFMDQLPVIEYRKLNTQLHRVIGVSRNTLINYSLIKITSKKDVPYSTIRKLEIIFGVKYGDLTNQNITCDHYKKIIDRIPERPTRRLQRKKRVKRMEQPD
ncbi:DNA-binding Xre family transcriptional regulator [Pedobacter sp. AK017]|uniref:hypothetical protein n=1 Tax=Pedobacter sp. AK017 TaxID=2723073 RepID=UPI00160CF066|nr:hypothetical protein [Pedobacter sp. AK017]MBB5438887.1 DNA-binding Xre family transcriptional regulator [Pedobacter sp. AK017]